MFLIANVARPFIISYSSTTSGTTLRSPKKRLDWDWVISKSEPFPSKEHALGVES